jgi:Flp pilus assembly protein TadD
VLHYTKGELSRARDLLERSLAIRGAAKETEHPEYPANVNNLAVVLWSQGDLAGARRRYEQALGAFKRLTGDTHPNYAVTLSNLAAVLQDQGDLTGARPALERAVALRKAPSRQVEVVLSKVNSSGMGKDIGGQVGLVEPGLPREGLLGFVP